MTRTKRGPEANVLTKAAAADSQPEAAEPHIHEILEQAMIQTNVRTYAVMVSPKIAEILLGNNEGNRPLKQRVLETYMRDMEAGDFELTGETIILDENWVLMNGQHRLNACIKSGKEFPALIVQGVPRRAFLKLDSGDKRRAADWLSSGQYSEANAKTLAAALRVLWTFEQGALCSNKRYPSNDEIAHTLDRNRGIQQFMSSTFTKSVKGMPGSLVAALRYLFGTFDAKLAEDFFERLGTGERLTRDNPILTLRNRLLTAEHLSQLECAALVIKTWNAFVVGEPLSVLRFRTGKNGEAFPKIAGVEYEVKAKAFNGRK